METYFSDHTSFADYDRDHPFYDEIIDGDGKVKSTYRTIFEHLRRYQPEDFSRLNAEAKLGFFNQGITFSVYNENKVPQERIFPFDLLPRIIPRAEWEHIERGVLQRATAVNHFIKDLYHEARILKQGIVPLDLIASSPHYLKAVMGVAPPGGVYNHISGTDLIRHTDGDYYVLEDNLRCPSGVSYVLSNRQAMKRTLFGVFNRCQARTVADYPGQLLATLQSVKPEGVDHPTCAVLTPGVFNSAYYEHAFLAQSMGEELVEGRDLFVDNGFVYMKTIHGPVRVDVIYRRVDDEFLDPLEFRPDSLLGVPGLMGVYRRGNVSLVNAPGNGVADDKAVYIYMPEIIRYYLGEEPILRNVQTYRCERPDDLAYVLEHVEDLVIKPVDESGGYGIHIGNRLTRAEIEAVKQQLRAQPRKYVAQPIMALSVHPTYIEETGKFEPRHIDLRTFTLLGRDQHYVLQGGLTRVALRRGNLIVNSSQGGGSKDTWVVEA